MDLGLLGTEQACLQVILSHARVADHGLLAPRKYQSYVLFLAEFTKARYTSATHAMFCITP